MEKVKFERFAISKENFVMQSVILTGNTVYRIHI